MILLHDMDRESPPPARVTRAAVERPSEGRRDEDPFVVSGVTIAQFRWSLLLLMGT